MDLELCMGWPTARLALRVNLSTKEKEEQQRSAWRCGAPLHAASIAQVTSR